MPYVNDTERLMIIIDKEVKEKVKRLAKIEKRSMSSYIALLLEKHVKEMEEQHDNS